MIDPNFSLPNFDSFNPIAQQQQEQKPSRKGLKSTPWIYLGIMWGLETIDQLLLGGFLDNFGLHAQQPSPLLPFIPIDILGILSLPFLHGGWAHIISNSIGYVPLSFLIVTQNSRWFTFIFWFVSVLAGLGSWFISPLGSVGVGASGVVFGFWSFCLTRCLFRFTTLNLMVAILTFLWFGSLWRGAVPWLVPPGISWQGHLMGLIAGILCACVISKFGSQLVGEN